MSEIKASEKLSKELSESVERIIMEIKSSKTSTHEHAAMPQAQQGHKTIDEVAACPTCKPKLLEMLKPDVEKIVLQTQREKHKSMKHARLCTDCGEVLDGEKEENCPNCHGHNY